MFWKRRLEQDFPGTVVDGNRSYQENYFRIVPLMLLAPDNTYAFEGNNYSLDELISNRVGFFRLSFVSPLPPMQIKYVSDDDSVVTIRADLLIHYYNHRGGKNDSKTFLLSVNNRKTLFGKLPSVLGNVITMKNGSRAQYVNSARDDGNIASLDPYSREYVIDRSYLKQVLKNIFDAGYVMAASDEPLVEVQVQSIEQHPDFFTLS